MPKRPDEDITWRARFASLHNVRPLFAMVWETSPPLVFATVLLRLFRAILPLAMLWVPKLILDAVVAFVSHGTGNLNRIWKLVAIELGVAI
jgi:ATP-binding cassette subfamily B protein